jgi:hypothetical protein
MLSSQCLNLFSPIDDVDRLAFLRHGRAEILAVLAALDCAAIDALDAASAAVAEATAQALIRRAKGG